MEKMRFETLDALRGVAAFAVVLLHLSEVKLQLNLMPRGYLAVDFFFVLSGFVVAYAYEGALRGRLSWGMFVLRRLIRLYPLALLGAALGLAILLIKWRFFPEKVDPLPLIIVSGLFNGLMLPTFFGTATSRQELFPGNNPLWSLYFELMVNLAWAWFAVRIRTSILVIVSLTSAIALAILATRFGTTSIGYNVDTFWGGVARVCFGFPLGVLIYRLRQSIRISPVRFGPVLLGVALAVLLAVPRTGDADLDTRVDLAIIFLGLPMVVIIGIYQDTAGRLGVLLGELSYPIYVLHFPLLLAVSGVDQLGLVPINQQALVLFTVAFILVTAFLALRYFDEPVRRRLTEKLRRSGCG